MAVALLAHDPSQAILEHEYSCALMVRDQFEIVLQHIFHQEENQQRLQEILTRCDEILKKMLCTQSREAFLYHQDRLKKLHARLLEAYHLADNDLTQSIDAIKNNMNQLEQSRLAHLKNTSERYALLTQTGWISLDYMLLITATVLVFTPGLGGAAIAAAIFSVAVASLAYNVIDFAQTAGTLYTQPNEQEERRELSAKSKEILTQTLKDRLKIDPAHLSNMHLEANQAWLREKRWMNGLNYTTSGFSLALTVCGFMALLFPPISVTIPLAFVITSAVISFALPLVTSSILARKILKEQELVEQTKQETQASIDGDNRLMTEALAPLNLAEDTRKTYQSTDQKLMQLGVMSPTRGYINGSDTHVSTKPLFKVGPDLNDEEGEPPPSPHLTEH